MPALQDQLDAQDQEGQGVSECDMKPDKKAWWEELKARIGVGLRITQSSPRRPVPDRPYYQELEKPIPLVKRRGGFYVGQRVKRRDSPTARAVTRGVVVGFKDLSWIIKHDDQNGVRDFVLVVRIDNRSSLDRRNAAYWEPE